MRFTTCDVLFTPFNWQYVMVWEVDHPSLLTESTQDATAVRTLDIDHNIYKRGGKNAVLDQATRWVQAS